MNINLLWVALSLIAWGVGEGMFLYFQPLYLQQLGANPAQIGGILGAVGIAMTLAHIPAGYMADRFGRKPVLLLAWTLGCLSTAILVLANSIPFFIVGMAMYGLTSFVIGPLNSYVTAARGSWTVGRAITLISATFSIGSIAGPLLGGWIGNHMGLHTSFIFAFALFILSTIIIFRIQAQPLEPIHDRANNHWLQVIEPSFLRFLLIVFPAMFMMFLSQPLSQNFLQNERAINLEQIGMLLATRSLGVVLLSLVLGQLNARLGFLISQVGMGLFTILLWRSSDLPWFFLGYFLLGSFQTARSLAIAQARSLIKAENMGLAYGIIETSNAIVLIFAPLAAGLLYSFKPVLVYPVSFIGIILTLLFSFLFLPNPRKQML